MQLPWRILVAFLLVELSLTHAGETEKPPNEKPEDIGFHQPSLFPVVIPPPYVGTHAANTFHPQGSYPQPSPGYDNHNQGNFEGNGGPLNNGEPYYPGQPQPNQPNYNPDSSHHSEQYDSKDECHSDSCIEFHGYPPEKCGKHPWNIYECEYFVAIKRDYKRGKVHFTLSGIFDDRGARDNHGYVAVGISEDEKMGDDDVVECIQNSGTRLSGASAYHSYNYKWGQMPIRQKDDDATVKILSAYVRTQYGKLNLTCIFERPLKQKVANNVNDYTVPQSMVYKTVDLNKGKYTILLAKGQLKGPDYTELGQHPPPGQGGVYVSRLGTAKFWSGCHKSRPSNVLIASVVLLILFILPPFRK